MKQSSNQRWSRANAAYLGAFLGMALGVIHQIHHAFTSVEPDENPLAHIVPEFVGLTVGGALLLAAIAEVRNHLVS